MIVCNIRKTAIKEGDAWIDRKTIFGNPFVMGRDGSREEVIAQYEVYLRNKVKHDEIFREKVKALHGKRLFCWCAPLPCHGEVLIRVCEELNA